MREVHYDRKVMDFAQQVTNLSPEQLRALTSDCLQTFEMMAGVVLGTKPATIFCSSPLLLDAANILVPPNQTDVVVIESGNMAFMARVGHVLRTIEKGSFRQYFVEESESEVDGEEQLLDFLHDFDLSPRDTKLKCIQLGAILGIPVRSVFDFVDGRPGIDASKYGYSFSASNMHDLTWLNVVIGGKWKKSGMQEYLNNLMYKLNKYIRWKIHAEKRINWKWAGRECTIAQIQCLQYDMIIERNHHATGYVALENGLSRLDIASMIAEVCSEFGVNGELSEAGDEQNIEQIIAQMKIYPDKLLGVAWTYDESKEWGLGYECRLFERKDVEQMRLKR